MLQRGFGPPSPPTASRPTPNGATRLALTLELGSRITARQPPAQLSKELGREERQTLVVRHLATRAQQSRLEHAMNEVAAIAQNSAIPVAWLKFGALRAHDLLADGSRAASDLDVLVAPHRARALHRQLLLAGFQRSGFAESRHQLELLLTPDGTAVELHRCIVGLRFRRGGRFAEWADLEAGDLLLSPVRGPRTAFVPHRDVVAAHAIAHGLLQHAFAPRFYPLTRMLADAADLHAATPEWLPERARRWLRTDLSIAEIDGVEHLVAALVRGVLPPSGSAAQTLLHHVLAGATDEEYAEALKLRMVLQDVTDQPWPARMGVWWHRLSPTDRELDKIHGNMGPRQRLARRALRPLDLAARLARYSYSALRVRCRRRAKVA